MLDLEPIKARLEAASPGEWSSEAWCLVNGPENTIGEIDNCLNMEFVIAAHNIDIPALIAEVERLREQLQAAVELNIIREGQLRSELAHITSIQAGVDVTVARAVARERDACAETVLHLMIIATRSASEMDRMYAITTWRLGTSDALEQAVAAIRARGQDARQS